MNNFYLSYEEALTLNLLLHWTLEDFELAEDDEKMLRDIISRIRKLYADSEAVKEEP